MNIFNKCCLNTPLLLFSLPIFSFAQETLDKNLVDSKPLAISAAIDVGQIVAGESVNPAADLDGQFLQRTGVWLTQRATVNQRLDLTMGVGGMFWYALPEQKGIPHSLVTRFGPGISQAFAVYKFGDIQKPAWQLQMGFFPFKYNPDAKNLGEYLMRSGTYPGVLVTGGWNIVSSAAYMMQGLRLSINLWEGRFRSDFLLSMERNLPPMYSLSPTYMGTLGLFPGFELGAGINFNHFIPIKPSKESPHTVENQIILERRVNDDSLVLYEYGSYYVNVYNTDLDSLAKPEYYTFQGIKLSGRIAFDPKAYFESSILGSQDLRVYGEVAVLGWKDYSVLYAKRTERIPVMFGINLPAFGFLDVLSLEVQYYGSKFDNSLYEPYQNQTPTWTLQGNFEEDPGEAARTLLSLGAAPDSAYAAAVAANAEYEKRLSEDNWKWSIYAKKEIYKGLRLYSQIASDHMRPTDINTQPFAVPVTNRNGKDWYYLLRLEFGI